MLEKLGQALGPQIDSLKDVISEEELKKIMLEVDSEVLGSFIGSVFSELAVVMAGYFKGNEENFKRIVELFKNELLLKAENKPEPVKFDEDLHLPAEWNDLVKKV